MDEKLAALLQENNISPDGFVQKSESGTVYSGELPSGINRVETWLQLLKGAQRSGYYPVLRGDPESIYTGYHPDPQTILANAPSGPLNEILAPLITARIESLTRVSKMFPEATVELVLDELPIDIDDLGRRVDKASLYTFGGRRLAPREWPTSTVKPTKIKFNTINNLKNKPCAISMVKAAKGYEALAHIVFEPGESGLYTPELLVSTFREWRDQYRIAPAVITGDTIECIVLRPPSTEEECLKLAAEQWIFCEDIVGQGTQSVRNLAIELCSSRTCFFWWD